MVFFCSDLSSEEKVAIIIKKLFLLELMCVHGSFLIHSFEIAVLYIRLWKE